MNRAIVINRPVTSGATYRRSVERPPDIWGRTMRENIIFGTHSSAELRILNHRARRSGIQHGANITPRDPRPGEPVTLHVWTGPDVEVQQMMCFYTTDGNMPSPTSHSLTLSVTATEWDPLLWGYVTHWEATLPGQAEGTVVWYRIGARTEGGTWVFADNPQPGPLLIAETRRHFGDDAVHPPQNRSGQMFAYTVDTLQPPAWAREAIVYQIFVDRFNRGVERPFIQTDDLEQVCGGTLRGVTEKLDYLAELGVNTLWLSPIFPSPSAHGYDATDYRRIEPRLGNMADFRMLVQEAHRRNLRIVLDLALNHCSDRHPFFQDALHTPTSPYREWFHFDSIYPHGYRGYFGSPTMPEWNHAHPAVQRYLIEAARFWLGEGVDGFRLDFADGPGPSFWSIFRAACRAVNPDVWLFGEIVQPPNLLQPYHGRLDGALDFLWEQQVRHMLAYGHGHCTEMFRFCLAHRAALQPGFLQPVFIDNHDLDRFLFAAEGDVRRLKVALAFLMLWPQPPILFYGTEVGLTQRYSKDDPGRGLSAGRVAMEWSPERQNTEVLEAVRQLIALRKAHPDLIYGSPQVRFCDTAMWVTSYTGQNSHYLVAVNLGPMNRRVPSTTGTLLWSSAPVDTHMPPLSVAIWELQPHGAESAMW